MILEAAKAAAGKTSPTAYMHGILSNWKNKGYYTVESAEAAPLTQEDYNREYARRRTVAVSRAQKNLERAQNIDGFSDVYARLFGIEKDLAFAEISGDKDVLNELEKEKSQLFSDAEKMLNGIGLTYDDLSPKYACEKCNDTGYVGTKRCDCFDKKVD